MEKHLTLTIAAGLALMAGTSGCRIGNHETDAPTGDGITGYYATQPEKLTFYATHSASTLSMDAPPNRTPDRVASILTDPIALQLEDAATGSAILFAAVGAQDYFPITIDAATQQFGVSGSYPQSTLWDDSACLTQEFVEIQGSIDPLGSTPATMSFQGASYSLMGTLGMTVRIEEKITGTCAASLQAMSDCYQDVTACGGSSAAENQSYQAAVQAYFSPYITAGVMLDSDIPTTSSMAYEVTYQ